MGKLVAVRLPDDVSNAVDAAAREQNCSKTDIIIGAVREKLMRDTVGRPEANVVTKRKTRLLPGHRTQSSPVPVSVETPVEAAQVPRVLKEPKYVKATRDNLPGPRPVVEPDREEIPSARVSNACTHGNDPKFCMHCRIFEKKYRKARNA